MTGWQWGVLCWLVLSVPLGLFVAAFIHFGQAGDQ